MAFQSPFLSKESAMLMIIHYDTKAAVLSYQEDMKIDIATAATFLIKVDTQYFCMLGVNEQICVLEQEIQLVIPFFFVISWKMHTFYTYL